MISNGWILAMFAASRLAAAPTAQTVDSAAQQVSLGALVDRVLGRSPAITQAQERVREANAGLSEARMSSLPRLSAKSALTRGDDPVYAFGSLLEQRRFGMQNFAIGALNYPGYMTNVKSSLELGVPLFTGFALTDRRELSRMQMTAAGAGEESSRQATRYQVIEAYLRLLLDRALLENADDRIKSATAEVEEARRLRARGLVLGSDFYAAEALFGSLQAARVRIQSELAATQSTLSVLMESAGPPVEPVGGLGDVGYSTAPLSALTEGALRDRQDLREAAVAESAAAVLARREAFSVLPTVEAFAALETNTSDFGSNPTNRMIGVRAALPIGDPTYFERRKRTAASQRAAHAGKESLEQAARVEVGQRYHEYQAAVAMRPILRDSVEKAEKSLELFRPLYREGRQSIFDVLRAEDALMKVRAGYLETLFSAHTGYARLQLAAGRLDSDVIREIESRLGGGR